MGNYNKMRLDELLENKREPKVPGSKKTEISDVYGIIYRIYCVPENKNYIGKGGNGIKMKPAKFIPNNTKNNSLLKSFSDINKKKINFRPVSEFIEKSQQNLNTSNINNIKKINNVYKKIISPSLTERFKSPIFKSISPENEKFVKCCINNIFELIHLLENQAK